MRDYFIMYYDPAKSDWFSDRVSLHPLSVRWMLTVYEAAGYLHAYEVAVDDLSYVGEIRDSGEVFA